MTDGLSTLPAEFSFRLFSFLHIRASGLRSQRDCYLARESFGRGTAEPCGEWGGDGASPPKLSHAQNQSCQLSRLSRKTLLESSKFFVEHALLLGYSFGLITLRLVKRAQL